MVMFTKGYKGFDKDLRCRDFQYEVGKEYEHDGALEVCKSGFHFCENPLDVFSYYSPADSRFCEVEGLGNVSKSDDDSKVSTSKIKVVAEIGLRGLIEAGVKFIFDKVDFTNKKKFNTGVRSTAANIGSRSTAANIGSRSTAVNTGARSAATNTGSRSAAVNTGDRSAAANTGDWSTTVNMGDRSAATNTGDQSAATNIGSRSTAVNTGDRSTTVNTGDCSAAANTGDWSTAVNTGDWSAAANTGDCSAASVSGNDSIAIVTGYRSKAKGAKGCWLVLTERDVQRKILCVKSAVVDGEVIKEDTFYELINGEFVEVK